MTTPNTAPMMGRDLYLKGDVQHHNGHMLEPVPNMEGITMCRTCLGGEGSLPTVCPERRLTTEESDAIYAGQLDFDRGTMTHQPVWWRLATEAEMQLLMERNAWRAALVGLCQGREAEVGTPEKAAAHMRERLGRVR